MDLMIELGCDLEGRNHIGETSLLLACYTCDLQLLKVFLSKGADVFAVDMCGNGALHKLLFGRWTALWRDQDPAIYEMVTILIEHGCDPKALNNSGISPTEIAYSFERQGVAEIWLKALHSAGYVLRNAINRFGRRWGVAVLTSDRYAKKLPKSDLTIEEWAAIREQLHILSHDESNEIKLSEISRRARRMYDRIWKMMRVSGALSPSQVPRRNKRHFRSWYRYGRGQSKWQRHHQSHRFIDQFRFDKEYHYMMRVERVHDSHYS
ncbi:hypothetical protein MFRU_017g01440 [Monilinia fructicola]|nr:hypothetical protein MFRU_017g01440 [Monilinia fructicola]